MDTVNPIPAPAAREPMADSAAIGSARAYENVFVPALFGLWTDTMIDAAEIARGQSVLDIACGTGILARRVADCFDENGRVVGLDCAPGMLAVAREIAPHIEWRHGDACRLPFADRSFDRVLCQFGLMFFSDPVRAVREMLRVLRPGGRLVIATWDDLDANPGFAEKVGILQDTVGTRAADALRAPFCLGDTGELAAIASRAGVSNPGIDTRSGSTRFRSLEEFVNAELRGWLPVMDVHLDEDAIAAVLDACRGRMSGYGAGHGFGFPVSAHILTGAR